MTAFCPKYKAKHSVKLNTSKKLANLDINEILKKKYCHDLGRGVEPELELEFRAGRNFRVWSWSQSHIFQKGGAGAGVTYFKKVELELHIFKRLKLEAIF